MAMLESLFNQSSSEFRNYTLFLPCTRFCAISREIQKIWGGRGLIISAFTLIQRERLNAQWVIATSSLVSEELISFKCGGLWLHNNVLNPVHLRLGESMTYTQKIKTLNSVLDRHQVVCFTKKSGAKLGFGYKLKASNV